MTQYDLKNGKGEYCDDFVRD